MGEVMTPSSSRASHDGQLQDIANCAANERPSALSECHTVPVIIRILDRCLGDTVQSVVKLYSERGNQVLDLRQRVSALILLVAEPLHLAPRWLRDDLQLCTLFAKLACLLACFPALRATDTQADTLPHTLSFL
jgi:hypothetical protein